MREILRCFRSDTGFRVVAGVIDRTQRDGQEQIIVVEDIIVVSRGKRLKGEKEEEEKEKEKEKEEEEEKEEKEKEEEKEEKK